MKKQTYAEATKNSPPNKLLIQALEFTKQRNKTLDIGAGSLRDSLFLKSKGFREVTAIDKEIPEASAEEINFIHGKIEEFDLPQEEYDLVVAINSLPFLSNDDFKNIFPKISNCLNDGGVLCFTLFGDKDGWNSASKKEKMNFHTKDNVLDMLEGFSDIKIFIEEEREGKTVNGQKKHWHIFRVVAVK
ncbi:MAG: class I SAM-dependent methyltransferase [Candidatus Paceibacterota bacterium]